MWGAVPAQRTWFVSNPLAAGHRVARLAFNEPSGTRGWQRRGTEEFRRRPRMTPVIAITGVSRVIVVVLALLLVALFLVYYLV